MSLDGCVSLKCPCVWPTWLLPFFSLLLLFYHCFLSLSVLLNSRTQMSSLFSPPPLSLFLRSLRLCSALCFISLVCLFLCFYNPQLSVLFMFSRAETRAHKRGHHVCVYKHVCTYTHHLMTAGALPSCSFCVWMAPEKWYNTGAPMDQPRLM